MFIQTQSQFKCLFVFRLAFNLISVFPHNCHSENESKFEVSFVDGKFTRKVIFISHYMAGLEISNLKCFLLTHGAPLRNIGEYHNHGIEDEKFKM